MAVSANAVLNFFKKRLSLFAQIAKTQKPALMQKTEDAFLEATMQYLPTIGMIPSETALAIHVMLDEGPGMDKMSEETKSTIQESLVNITSQEELGCSQKPGFAAAATPVVAASGLVPGLCAAAKPGTASAKANPSPSSAAAKPSQSSAAAKPGPSSAEAKPGSDPTIVIDLSDDDAPVAAAAPPAVAPPAQDSVAAPPALIRQPSGFISGVTKQMHLSAPTYLTAPEWDFFGSDKSDMAKAQVACKFIIRNMLWKVPEAFYGSLAGLILACTNRASGHPDHLQMVIWIKYHAAQAKPGNLDLNSLVYTFPDDPMQLPEPWRSRSQCDGPTVPSRLSPGDWQLIINAAPSRNTHKSVKELQRAGTAQVQRGRTRISAIADGDVSGSTTISTLALPQNTGTLFRPPQTHVLPPMMQPCASAAQPACYGSMDPAIAQQAGMHAMDPAYMQHMYQASAMFFQQQYGGRGAVNPMGPSTSARIQVGGSQCKVEELSDRDGSPPPAESPPPAGSPGSAAAEPRTLAIAKQRMLMGSMGAGAGGCEAPSRMLDFMDKTRTLLGGPKRPAEVEVEDADEEEEEEEKAPKRPRTAEPPKRPRTAKVAAKSKARLSPPLPLPKSDAVLKFPGTKKHAAIKYGECTIYMDAINKCWRLKTEKGSTHLLHFYFKPPKNPRAVWEEVLKELKKHA